MVDRFIKIPPSVDMKDYQLDAIESWVQNDCCGYFDMATGTGKTYTALASLERFSSMYDGKVATFIVCPYKHLVGQWEEDLYEWGARPIVCHSEAPDKNWKNKLEVSFKRFRQLGYPFVCITTNKTFVGEAVQRIVEQIDSDMKIVFVVDEAHNFGATNLSRKLPINISYRLGLSATFERFNDEVGTKALTSYFKNKCITYNLKKAISDGKSLCPYEYYPIYTFLSSKELEKYEYLTRKIYECLVEEDGEVKLTEAGELLLYKRSRLLASAENKIDVLRELLNGYKNEKFMLIYCGASTKYSSDGEEFRLIEEITDIVNNEFNITAHKFTAEENIKKRLELKEMFADGKYQALTAIRCLDEGVNIPNIRTAFIMSSSKNPKEFIQRRGRLLRKAEGKEKAVIYDFIILPRQLSAIRACDYETDKSIVLGEMSRAYEFGRLSLNPIETDKMIEELQSAYDVRFDLDEITKYSEEDIYGEY